MQYLIYNFIDTAAMLLVYALFLRNSAHYKLSRLYLLLCAVLPIFLPLVHLPQSVEQHLQRAVPYQVTLPEVTIGTTQKLTGNSLSINYAVLCYCAISTGFLLWFGRWTIKVLALAGRSTGKTLDGYTLITKCGYGPGSFGRYIFFPGEDVNAHILTHEQAHVKLHHSTDMMLIYLLHSILWPNLLLLWIKKELRQVHEFQADGSVHTDNIEYSQLLLQSVFNTSHVPIMNLFFIHPIKRRIMMFQKQEKSPSVKTICLTGACLALLLSACFIIQSCNKKTDSAAYNSSGREIPSPQMKQALLNPPPGAVSKRPDSLRIYSFADKMPTAGYDYQAFLAQNIHYPAYDKVHNIGGKVIVRFVVDEQGNVNHVKCVRPVETSLDNEALRVVSMFPRWQPGEQGGKKVPVYFTLPIVFQPSATTDMH